MFRTEGYSPSMDCLALQVLWVVKRCEWDIQGCTTIYIAIYAQPNEKFSAENENVVIFEKEQSRSRDILRYVQHGKSGSYMTYRPQRVRQACRNAHFGRFYGFQHGNMPNITFPHVF